LLAHDGAMVVSIGSRMSIMTVNRLAEQNASEGFLRSTNPSYMLYSEGGST